MDPFSVLKLISAPELNGLLIGDILSSVFLFPLSGPPAIKIIKRGVTGLSIKKNGNSNDL